MRQRFFISYSSRDQAAASALELRLVAEGHIVWRDRGVLRSADDWREEIAAGIDACDDFVLLLSQTAGESAEVRKELERALLRQRRVHVFSGHDVRSWPIYPLISHINIVALPPFEADLGTQQIASQMSHHLLGSASPPHPLEPRDFERIYSRRLVPPRGSEGMSPQLAERYAGYRARSAATTPLLLANYALLLAHLGRWSDGLAILDQLRNAEGSPLLLYLRSLLLVGGQRPLHLLPSRRDEAITVAESAYRSCRSPLIALQLGSLYWDSRHKRGPNTATFFKAALEALVGMPSERRETKRFLQLSSLRGDIDLPFERGQIVGLISQFSGA